MKKHDKTDIFIAGITILVFGCFFLCFDVRQLGDSGQHLTGSIAREPVYALFLKMMRGLFGEGFFERAVGFVQNTLAIIAILYAEKALARLFSFRPFCRYFSLLCLLAPHLMTPLASRTHMILTNSILTEGITFSFYYIWIVLLLKILFDKQIALTSSLITFFLSFFLSLIRGQMMVLILVWAIVIGYKAIRLEKAAKRWKLLLLVVGMLAAAFAGRTLLVKSYNYLQNGFFVNTTSGKPMMLANVMYMADKKDAELIKDKELEPLFAEILRRLEVDQKTYQYAGSSLLEKAKFHESVHDDINFEYIAPVIRDYVELTTGINGSRFEECMMALDDYSARIASEVLPGMAGKYIENYFVIASLGFIRSIGVEISFIPLFVVVAYLLAIVLAVYLWIKNKNSRGAHFMLLVLLLICGNVFSTALMIQCISRYMIYNLPFFYIAFVVMLLETKKEGKKDVQELKI